MQRNVAGPTRNSDPNSGQVIKVSNDPACQQLMSMLKKGFPLGIKEVHPIICPFSHLKAMLSIEMRSTLELAIGIDSDSDKDVDTILDALYAHIRASCNVAIDRVDFEKRVQRSGEKFDKFLRGILELRNTPKSHG